jgi:hypothetical protein
MAEQGIRHHRAASSGQFPLINGIGAGWYEKDYTTYGYEFGSWKSRFDLFDAGLERIEARLGQLIPVAQSWRLRMARVRRSNADAVWPWSASWRTRMRARCDSVKRLPLVLSDHQTTAKK